MGAEHTQGPWSLDATTGRVICDVDWLIGPPITVRGPELPMGTTGEHERQSWANARLIIAAPEMVAVLRTVEWASEADTEEGGREIACPCCGSARRVGHGRFCSLAAAIAKAEGRAP